MALATPDRFVLAAVSLASLLFLALLGALGPKTGRAKPLRAAIQVTFWGTLAMAITTGTCAAFGTQVWTAQALWGAWTPP